MGFSVGLNLDCALDFFEYHGEDEHDTEEQDDDMHDRTSEEAEAEAADKAENEEVVIEADLAEDVRKEGEQEVEGQREAARESEREREKKTGDETEPHSGAKGKTAIAAIDSSKVTIWVYAANDAYHCLGMRGSTHYRCIIRTLSWLECRYI